MSEKKHDDQWTFLTGVMPDAKGISETCRKDLYGLVRRTIIKEHELEAEAINVYRLDDDKALSMLVDSLPCVNEETVHERIDELRLPPEDAEIELSHWAFNYQSVKGELLVNDLMIKFRLVRLQEYVYLLLCRDDHPEIAGAFAKAFDRDCGAFSRKALHVENKHWCGWAWFTHPDESVNRDSANQIREVWESMDK